MIIINKEPSTKLTPADFNSYVNRLTLSEQGNDSSNNLPQPSTEVNTNSQNSQPTNGIEVVRSVVNKFSHDLEEIEVLKSMSAKKKKRRT